MRKIRKMLLVLGITFVVAVVVLAVVKARWDSHYYDGYDPSLPLNAAVTSEKERSGYLRTTFEFDGVPGQRVPGLMAQPRDAKGPVPCVIFLHGIGQDKEFLDAIAEPFIKSGFALVSYDQYTRGERPHAPKGLAAMFALRRRGSLTVIETRRLIDYLETRADIASDRIYLCGASYGAITGSTAAAFDQRIRAVVLTYGGGNLPILLASDETRKMLGRWTGPLTRVLAWVMSPGDPLRHVAEISPRPILFQNGKRDSLIPVAAAQALFDAAREPKEIVWYDSDHIGLDKGLVMGVIGQVIDWVKQRDQSVQHEAFMPPEE